mmetsp:Transcript_6533/g.9921  ORF Transcript_6533/g.9921 Transcript_6533/m.9921 type:complete len:244 (-) Transcript_6533:1250-1981(-)
MDGTNDNNDLLHSYLNETLPSLGLDSDTYSPYVIGCLENNDESNHGEEVNEEELNEIIELLRASSESHSDDEIVWNELKNEVLKHHGNHQRYLLEKKNAELNEMKKADEEKRQKEIEAAMEAQREMESRKQQAETQEIDSAKKALLDQYGYDTSEQFDKDGNVVDPNTSGSNKKSGPSAEGGEDLNNRAAAQKAQTEKAQNLRKSQNQSSKKDERIKTKNAKLDKMKQKEERRKRATKGERRR